MNPTLLLQTSAWLLAVTAAGGLIMAFIRFGRQGLNPPAWLAMLHGFLAAAGLTLLAFAALTVGIPGIALAGLALLLVAAGGGVLMNLGYQLKDVPLPKWLVGVHAALAVVGFAMVVLAALEAR
ncbi:MAG: hypothetical protein M3Z31_13490 [Pseudomonadota bacterium]|nr:hypothetical protein [Pseudomonadota bacterium]